MLLVDAAYHEKPSKTQLDKETSSMTKTSTVFTL
jgi:hypothetical protein